MKRFIPILMILLLIGSLPVFARTEPKKVDPSKTEPSTFDYYEGQTANEKYLIYSFPYIKLYLPMEWKDLYLIDQKEDGVTFYHKASHEKYLEEGIKSGGFLFELCASEDESYKDLPAYEDLGYCEDAGLHFYLRLSSDYPAYMDDTIKAEYDEMAAQIKDIIEKVKIGKSVLFFPEDGTGPNDIA